jgi:aminopeptidase
VSCAMRDRSSEIDRLAELLVGFGANLQPGQILAVSAYLGMEKVARAVVKEADRRGAK